ncbi:hypothetical protein ACFQ6N_07205 [Kitasatospora sp. NPDC056446]|uniref:hypothetical protein n=1 Tax=Kitasatospora sp. NPDC056446 TaxID=3345819 RepID=UPI0036A37FA9
MLRFHGAWRITVVGRSADFDQRAVVRGAYGLRMLPGRVGATLEMDEESWTLSLEHHLWGRSWQPNLRTTPGPLTERDGVRSQLLTSNDCHWPGKPMDYVNFVLRLDQAVAPAPAPVRAARPAGAPIAAPVQSVRTSSPGLPGNDRVTVPGHAAVPGSRPGQAMPAVRPGETVPGETVRGTW